jgi:hydrogenase maturation protease
VLTDFQLQIEHVIDLENRQRVIFVDASVSAKAPFEFYRIQADKDNSYTTHAMSPQSLLAVYEKVNKQAAPPSFLLSVRGYEFGLGLAVSDKAGVNLGEAVVFIKQCLADSSSKEWKKQIKSRTGLS